VVYSFLKIYLTPGGLLLYNIILEVIYMKITILENVNEPTVYGKGINDVRGLCGTIPYAAWQSKLKQNKRGVYKGVHLPDGWERLSVWIQWYSEYFNFPIEIQDTGCNLRGVSTTINYARWNAMKARCREGGLIQTQYETYKGCYIADEWLTFSSFNEWCIAQDMPDDYVLDKDILVKGNKCYGSKYCALVPREINNLFIKSNSIRGGLPIGVSLNKYGTYDATVSKFGNNTHLGTYKTVSEAFNSYKIAKEAHIMDIANLYKDKVDERVYNALMTYEVEVDD
jgi:hypothetical protein